MMYQEFLVPIELWCVCIPYKELHFHCEMVHHEKLGMYTATSIIIISLLSFLKIADPAWLSLIHRLQRSCGKAALATCQVQSPSFHHRNESNGQNLRFKMSLRCYQDCQCCVVQSRWLLFRARLLKFNTPHPCILYQSTATEYCKFYVTKGLTIGFLRSKVMGFLAAQWHSMEKDRVLSRHLMSHHVINKVKVHVILRITSLQYALYYRRGLSCQLSTGQMASLQLGSTMMALYTETSYKIPLSFTKGHCKYLCNMVQTQSVKGAFGSLSSNE